MSYKYFVKKWKLYQHPILGYIKLYLLRAALESSGFSEDKINWGSPNLTGRNVKY